MTPYIRSLTKIHTVGIWPRESDPPPPAVEAVAAGDDPGLRPDDEEPCISAPPRAPETALREPETPLQQPAAGPPPRSGEDLACGSPRPSRRTSYMAFKGAAPGADDPLLGFAPAPHVAPRRNSITAARQKKFIAELAATGIVTQAARSIGASLEALYKLRNKPGAEGFAAAWDLAIDRGVMRLEDCALARAIEGEERMVVSAGKVLGTERRHNESLVMFLLRQRRTGRYGGEVGPGHPLYERIRAEVLAGVAVEQEVDEQEMLESLDQFLAGMRERRIANTAILLETAQTNDGDER